MITSNAIKTLFLGVALMSSMLCASNDTGGVKPKEWSILMYMNTYELESWAIQNLSDAAMGVCDDTTNLMAFVNHQPGRAWVYRVKNKQLIQERFIEGIGTHEENIVELMTEMKEKCPAQQYGLVLWGHGSGLIDMSLDCVSNKFKYPEESDAKTCEACM